MNKTTFKLQVPDETCNYLQRLSHSIDSRLEVINKIFTIHADDPDASVLESKPFQKYHTEFEELQAEYNQAKLEFQNQLEPIVYEKMGKHVNFRWTIKDFLLKEVDITIFEGEK